METGPWDFGWEALVALSTLTLAGVTAWLAATTRKVARATAADVQAQWRPVLIPAAHGAKKGLDYQPSIQRLRVRVRNAGRGPALFVRAELDPHGSSPNDWHLGTLAPEDEVTLTFTGVTLGDFAQLLLDYRDLSDRTYSSSFVIDHIERQDMGEGPRQIYRLYDVRLFEGERLTGHGDAPPQQGLRELPRRDE